MGIGRAVAAATIGITGLGLLGACGWNIATETYSDSDGIGDSFVSVRFANDSGNVTIRRGDSPSVERTVHHNGDKPRADTFRVKDGVLELNSCDTDNCWIDYEVVVPAETTVAGQLDSGAADITGVAEVNVRSSSGEVTIGDVEGTVNIEASSGSVNLSDIGGTVAAKVDSGSVSADGVRGAFTLAVSSGSVEARGIGGATEVDADSSSVVVELTSVEDVRVNADSGNVEVGVPQGSYEVVTSADSGQVDSEIEHDPAGDHRIDLHTDSGNIEVTRV
jgi:hypothetical protein